MIAQVTAIGRGAGTKGGKIRRREFHRVSHAAGRLPCAIRQRAQSTKGRNARRRHVRPAAIGGSGGDVLKNQGVEEGGGKGHSKELPKMAREFAEPAAGQNHLQFSRCSGKRKEKRNRASALWIHRGESQVERRITK